MDAVELRESVRGMNARFERDVRPFIEAGVFCAAASEIEQILMILRPLIPEIMGLPHGSNYITHLQLLIKDMQDGNPPNKYSLQGYDAYSRQLVMPR